MAARFENAAAFVAVAVTLAFADLAAAQTVDPALSACNAWREMTAPHEKAIGQRIEGRSVVIALERVNGHEPRELRCVFKLNSSTGLWRFDDAPSAASTLCDVIGDSVKRLVRADRLAEARRREAELRDCLSVQKVELNRAAARPLVEGSLASRGAYPIPGNRTALRPSP